MAGGWDRAERLALVGRVAHEGVASVGASELVAVEDPEGSLDEKHLHTGGAFVSPRSRRHRRAPRPHHHAKLSLSVVHADSTHQHNSHTVAEAHHTASHSSLPPNTETQQVAPQARRGFRSGITFL